MNKILLVEDEIDQLRMLELAFKSSGYEIILASSGEEGYVKAQEQKPDLIISDILMPHTSGLELCKKLKGNAQFSDTPIIITTALYKGEDYTKMAKAHGADAVFSKPYNIQELLQTARTLLATGSSQESSSDEEGKNYPLDLGDA